MIKPMKSFKVWAENAIKSLKKNASYSGREKNLLAYNSSKNDSIIKSMKLPFVCKILDGRYKIYSDVNMSKKDVVFISFYSDRPGISVMLAAISFYIYKTKGSVSFIDIYDIIGDDNDKLVDIFSNIWDDQKIEGSNMLDDINFVKSFDKENNEEISFNDKKEMIKRFKEITDINLFNYMDTILLKIGVFSIDIIAFDDFLHSKYGIYENDGMSMKEFITSKFGEEASNIIEKII